MAILDQLVRITRLDKFLMKELARRAHVGGIQTHFAASDEMVGETAIVEEALSQFNLITRMHRQRSLRYQDYDAMDNYGDISVALDIFAEEASQKDLVEDKNLWFTGDPEVVKELERLAKRLRLRTMLYGFSRQVAKYGDMFISPRYSTDGIDKILFLPPRYVTRVGSGTDQVKHYQLDNQFSVLSPRDDGILLPWECVHFRILSFGYSMLYGHSLIEASRKRWLHLKLLEDAVAIYRLNRAVERLVFYIDVGSAGPAEALRIVSQYRRKFGNRRRYINPSEADYEQQYDPTSMHENIYYPRHAGNERSAIDKLNPPPDQNRLQDLEHFDNKLYVSLGIPRDYITGDMSGNWNSRESLTLQDVRFSRKIHRLQMADVEGIETLCRFHLTVLWGDADKAAKADFKVHMADVSKMARQQYDQVLQNRVELMTSLENLGESMGFRREPWLRFVIERFMEDIPPQLVNRLLIPDRELARMQAGAGAAGGAAPRAQLGELKEDILQRILGGRRGSQDVLAAAVREDDTEVRIPGWWLRKLAESRKESTPGQLTEAG